MSDSPIRCTIDLDGPGKQLGHLRVPRSSNTSGWSSLTVPIVSVANGDGPTAVVIGGVHGDEPEGQVAAIKLARELEPRARRGPRDRHPVPLARGLARVHAALAVGREHEPLVPRQPRRPGGRAAGALPLDRDLPALGGRRRHPLRRSHRPLPAVVGDALGRGRRPAAAHGGRDARVEHRLVLRLHRHRRDGPPRRRGGAPGQDGDLDRARRRRPRDRGDPPARGRRARERPAPRGRPRGPGRDPRGRSGGRRRRS